MLALDVSGLHVLHRRRTRTGITAAEQAASAFIKSQAGGPRSAWSPSPAPAGVLVPPTADTDALLERAQQPDHVARHRDRLGDPHLDRRHRGQSTRRSRRPASTPIRRRRSGYAADVIVVLTDGANTQGVDPQTAAEAGGRPRRPRLHHRLRHHDPGPHGLHRPRRSAAGRRWRRLRRRRWPVGGRNPLVIDEDALRQIAETTGGQYYRAQERRPAAGRRWPTCPPRHGRPKHVDLASWFAALGGLLIAAAVGLSLWWNRIRAPRSASSRP